jgi:hypothetical protein
MKYITFILVIFHSLWLYAEEINITSVWNGDNELSQKPSRFNIGQRGMKSKGFYKNSLIFKKLDSSTLIGESCSFEVYRVKKELFLYWIIESSKEGIENEIIVSRRPGDAKLAVGRNEIELSSKLKFIVHIKN